jgi:hypothetical protein
MAAMFGGTGGSVGGDEERRERRWVQIMATSRALAHSSSWLQRTRETLVFSSASSVARTVDMDLEIPDGVDTAYGEDARALVIGFAPRSQAGAVRVLDEAGAALPTLTTVESDALVYELLAARVLGDLAAANFASASVEVSEIAAMLRAIAGDPRLLSRLGAGDSPQRDVLDAIRANAFVFGLLGAMSSAFPLVVQLPAAPRRRVLAYTYEDVLVSRRRFDVRASLGWRETRIMVALPGVPLSRQHDFAIEAPDGVALTRLRVIGLPGSPDPAVSSGESQHAASIVQRTGRFATASVDLIPHGRVLLEVRLRPDPSYPAAVLATALAVALVLSAGLIRLGPLSTAPEAAAAVLLAVPALFTTLVAQPVRGSPAAKLLSGARLILILSGLLAYVAALMIVLYPDSSGKISSVLEPFWLSDCATAWALVALLLVPVAAPVFGSRE